jgi:hypothetical protein
MSLSISNLSPLGKQSSLLPPLLYKWSHSIQHSQMEIESFESVTLSREASVMCIVCVHSALCCLLGVHCNSTDQHTLVASAQYSSAGLCDKWPSSRMQRQSETLVARKWSCTPRAPNLYRVRACTFQKPSKALCFYFDSQAFQLFGNFIAQQHANLRGPSHDFTAR